MSLPDLSSRQTAFSRLRFLICEMGIMTAPLRKAAGGLQGRMSVRWHGACLGHLLSQFFPVPTTALGRAGGWPYSYFPVEDLMLTDTQRRENWLLSPSGLRDVRMRGWGCHPPIAGYALPNNRYLLSKGRVTPGAALRELPGLCPLVPSLHRPFVLSQTHPDASGPGVAGSGGRWLPSNLFP